MMGDGDTRDYTGTPVMMRPGDKPTLHEILMADKLDFEAKVERASRRKLWLKGNLSTQNRYHACRSLL